MRRLEPLRRLRNGSAHCDAAGRGVSPREPHGQPTDDIGAATSGAQPWQRVQTGAGSVVVERETHADGLDPRVIPAHPQRNEHAK